MRPDPTQPQASSPVPGPTVCAPRSTSVWRFFCVAGWFHMLTFIAGATSNGARQASATVVARSSAIPCASRARMSPVAGAITNSSAQSASSMCPMVDSCCRSNVSVATGCCESACRVSGVMNFCAALVMTTRTSAPALMHKRTSSAAL